MSEPAAITTSDYGATLPGEADVARYNVRRLKPKFPWLFLLVGVLLALVLAGAIVGASKGRAGASELAIIGGLLAIVIVGAIVKWLTAFRAAGVLFLTTRRLIYVEKGAGTWRRRRYVASVDLAWINGVQALTQEGWRMLFGLKLWRGKKTYYLRVDTRAFTPILIGATTAKSRGAVFEPDQGSLQSVQEIGARIRQLAVELPPQARAA
jgi:hypothetical protein